MAVAAHPFRPGRSLDPALVESGLVRVAEGVNGRDPRGGGQRARLWARAFGLSLVGGSDAHTLAESAAGLLDDEDDECSGSTA